MNGRGSCSLLFLCRTFPCQISSDPARHVASNSSACRLTKGRMKNSRNLSIACTLLLIAITLSSCSKKPADSLVGKWVVEGQSANVEFRKDGTLTSEENGHVTTGTYKFTDRTHMQ